MEENTERYKETGTGGLVRLCQAKLNGRHCNAYAMKDKNYCNVHGGKVPVGPDSVEFKTGLYSQNRKRFASLGRELLGRVEQLRDDPELFSLRDDAAYITALIDRRAEAAEEGLSVEVLYELRSLYSEAERAMADGQSHEFDKAFDKMGGIIKQGLSEAKATAEVIDLIGKRVDIIEAEQRMTHVKAYTLEVDQAYSLIQQVLKVVVQSVKDVEEMKAIRAGVQKLLRVYKEDDDVLDAEVVDEESSTEYQNAS
jgi:hypothetical protein